jgi:hypothetical protein
MIVRLVRPGGATKPGIAPQGWRATSSSRRASGGCSPPAGGEREVKTIPPLGEGVRTGQSSRTPTAGRCRAAS